MSKKIKMLTVVPANLATELAQKKKIKDYNTLPQINKTVLRLVKECMVERVGYHNLPMACLSSVKNANGKPIDGEDIFTYIPLNSKDSVIFQLEMPDDMLLSISFSDLLNISAEADGMDTSDEMELEYLKDELGDKMILGFDDGMEDPISFIPFLAFDRCQFYAKLDNDFKTKDLKITGIPETNLRELSSFMN